MAGSISKLSLLLTVTCFANNIDYGYLPEAMQQLQNDPEPFLSASFIYWKLDSDKFIFVKQGPPSGEEALTKDGFKELNYDFEPGFRVGAGWYLGRDGWDVTSRYTWYRTSSSRSVVNSSGDKEIGNWINEQKTDTPRSQRLEFDLRTHQVDIELGRNTSLAENLAIRPHIGVKGFVLNYTTHARYDMTSSDEEGIIRSINFSHSPGFGIRTGFESSWLIGHGVSSIGNVAFTGSWVFHRCSGRGTFEGTRLKDGPIPIPKFTNRNQVFDQSFLNLIVELQLGFRWEYLFRDETRRLQFDAAFEQQAWRGDALCFANELAPRLQPYSLKGLTMRGRFDF